MMFRSIARRLRAAVRRGVSSAACLACNVDALGIPLPPRARHTLFSLCKRRRRMQVGVGLLVLALVTAQYASPDETIVSPIIAAEEVFDGEDWEIRFSTRAGDVFFTDNTVDDRTVQFAANVAVWTRLSGNGWDIVAWEVGGVERVLTYDTVDDVLPTTDGASVVWQRYDDNRWRIMLYDLTAGGSARVLSDPRVTSMQPSVSDGRVVWQAWIDGNWEIVAWDGTLGTVRLTTNRAPDLSPDVEGDYAVWEGVDPEQRDRDVFAANVVTHDVAMMTANTYDDEAPTFTEGSNAAFISRFGPEATVEGTVDIALEFVLIEQENSLLAFVPQEMEVIDPCSEVQSEKETVESGEENALATEEEAIITEEATTEAAVIEEEAENPTESLETDERVPEEVAEITAASSEVDIVEETAGVTIVDPCSEEEGTETARGTEDMTEAETADDGADEEATESIEEDAGAVLAEEGATENEPIEGGEEIVATPEEEGEAQVPEEEEPEAPAADPVAADVPVAAESSTEVTE